MVAGAEKTDNTPIIDGGGDQKSVCQRLLQVCQVCSNPLKALSHNSLTYLISYSVKKRNKKQMLRHTPVKIEKDQPYIERIVNAEDHHQDTGSVAANPIITASTKHNSTAASVMEAAVFTI